ncbi:MAG: hypothetical protein QF402_19960, partial [Candidatus Latescibacteria bacterium]|nr:hypothetical protein [Candidatus Latescibacterota bacterium]
RTTAGLCGTSTSSIHSDLDNTGVVLTLTVAGEAHFRIMWYEIRADTTACGCDSEKGQNGTLSRLKKTV